MRMSLWYFIILKIILIFKSIPGQLFCRRLLEIINRMISLVPARKEKIIKASQLIEITALFTNMRILKFKSQLTIEFFAAVNHPNGPPRKQNFTLTGSKGHGL